MRSGIEDFSRPFFAFIWPSRPQWAPPRLLPARGENGKRGSDIKKTLSPPPLDRGTRRDLGCRPRSLWQQAHPSLLWHCAGSAARRTHTPDPSRRDHTTHAGHGVCRRPQPSSAAVSAVVAGTSSVSFVSAWMRKLTHFTVPPLQIEPAALGFDQVWNRRQGPSPYCIRTDLAQN